MTDIIQKDPPPTTRRLNYSKVLSHVYLHPDEWFRVDTDRATRNISPKLKAPGVKTRNAKNQRGLVDLYVKYVEEFHLGTCKKCGARRRLNRAGLCSMHPRDPKDMVLA